MLIYSIYTYSLKYWVYYDIKVYENYCIDTCIQKGLHNYR